MTDTGAQVFATCRERLSIDHVLIDCLEIAGHATDHRIRTRTGQEIRWISANRIPAIWQDSPAKPDQLDQLSAGDLDAIADRLAARLNLAVVQQVPQCLLDVMREGAEAVYPAAIMTGGSYAAFRFIRTGNVLTLHIELDNQRLATFRFQGDQPPPAPLRFPEPRAFPRGN